MRFLVLDSGSSRAAAARDELGEWLTHKLGEEVQVETAADYASLAAAAANGDAALLWMPPALFIEALDAGQVELVGCLVRRGTRAYHGVVFVPEGSSRTTADDLAGASFAWVDPSSCAGYLFPRYALREVRMGRDVALGEQRFVGSHVNVVRAVNEGVVDAGACWVHVAHDEEAYTLVGAAWDSAGATRPFRVIVLSEPVPSDTVCVHTSLPPTLRAAIRDSLDALAGGEEGQSILHGVFEAAGFARADAHEYAPVRRIAERVRALAG